MSLFIEVYVGNRDNRKLVASSHAYNISDLAEVSDYEFNSIEYGYEPLNISKVESFGSIKRHHRSQSVWNLVKKIADKSSGRVRFSEKDIPTNQGRNAT